MVVFCLILLAGRLTDHLFSCSLQRMGFLPVKVVMEASWVLSSPVLSQVSFTCKSIVKLPTFSGNMRLWDYNTAHKTLYDPETAANKT